MDIYSSVPKEEDGYGRGKGNVEAGTGEGERAKGAQ